MSLCPEPAEVLDVGTAHGTTRVYRFGEGDAPPLVLLPGLGATSACYADLLPALAATGPVYTVDTLGEPGRSVQRARLTTHADRARCLDDVLGELGLGEVHLVGGSTGGWHCVNQAVHAPERVASISLLDPTSVTAPFGRAVVALGLLCAVVRTERGRCGGSSAGSRAGTRSRALSCGWSSPGSGSTGPGCRSRPARPRTGCEHCGCPCSRCSPGAARCTTPGSPPAACVPSSRTPTSSSARTWPTPCPSVRGNAIGSPPAWSPSPDGPQWTDLGR